MNMVAIHTNHFQTSGTGWQNSSCSMRMEQGDYWDLCEFYRRDQNVNVGDETLLEGVPADIISRLREFGGSVEWAESANTETWETEVAHVVFNHNGETIWEDGYVYQK